MNISSLVVYQQNLDGSYYHVECNNSEKMTLYVIILCESFFKLVDVDTYQTAVVRSYRWSSPMNIKDLLLTACH